MATACTFIIKTSLLCFALFVALGLVFLSAAMDQDGTNFAAGLGADGNTVGLDTMLVGMALSPCNYLVERQQLI